MYACRWVILTQYVTGGNDECLESSPIAGAPYARHIIIIIISIMFALQ